eukprot:TRINITY_DN48995_c0_g1_i1.p1 TRINITY_DN48995_c0_g1~~TRINITY_DN48995_c0_g1_i1.p1  ORF type:complete len:389 (+),score=87.08 TRINITY_DN48995_c0_g1_i1:144-1310(+)
MVVRKEAAAAAKRAPASRLFGRAVAGVKDLKTKVKVVPQSRTGAAGTTPVLAAPATVAVPPPLGTRRLRLTSALGARQVRGRSVVARRAVLETAAADAARVTRWKAGDEKGGKGGGGGVRSNVGRAGAGGGGGGRGGGGGGGKGGAAGCGKGGAGGAGKGGGGKGSRGGGKNGGGASTDGDAYGRGGGGKGRFGGKGGPRWQHDHFEGPQTVGSTVFVRQLPKGTTTQQIGSLFAAVGQLASVQIDDGPLPTATVGYVRQDAALEAQRRFHGRWVQGVQLKVSAGAPSSKRSDLDDEEFWRRELKTMKKRKPNAILQPASATTGGGGGYKVSLTSVGVKNKLLDGSGNAGANVKAKVLLRENNDVKRRGRGTFMAGGMRKMSAFDKQD